MNKIKLGLVPNPGFEPEICRVTNTYLFKPRNDRKNGRFTFYCIGPRLFNSLPPSLRKLDDANTTLEKLAADFKTDLDKHLNKLPDNPGTQANSLLRIGHDGNEINNV